jgi:hypothetical protein
MQISHHLSAPNGVPHVKSWENALYLHPNLTARAQLQGRCSRRFSHGIQLQTLPWLHEVSVGDLVAKTDIFISRCTTCIFKIKCTSCRIAMKSWRCWWWSSRCQGKRSRLLRAALSFNLITSQEEIWWQEDVTLGIRYELRGD